MKLSKKVAGYVFVVTLRSYMKIKLYVLSDNKLYRNSSKI
jgi:hypothetical protein